MSQVVETRIVRAPAGDRFGTLLKVIRTVRPAGMLALLSSAQSIVSPEGLKQKPMSWPVVVSTTVAPRLPKLVPGGNVRSMRLLATLLSAPLAEDVNVTAYWVVADAAGFVTPTVTFVSEPAAMTA